MINQLLNRMSIELNGRSMNPILEEAISIYEKDYLPAIEQLRKVSKDFQLSLEPAPVYLPEK